MPCPVRIVRDQPSTPSAISTEIRCGSSTVHGTTLSPSAWACSIIARVTIVSRGE